MSTTDPHTSAPSADAERPPEAFPPFTERPPEAEVWRRARQDYLGGDTARIVCERYGLSERRFYRRATKENWRRTDVEASMHEDTPSWIHVHRRSVADVIADHPEYAEVQSAKDNERYNLLFGADPDDLRGFAFRRACEAAALYKPAESAAWLRVQRLLDQCRHVADARDGPYRPEDNLRAQYIQALKPEYGDGEDDEDDEDDEGDET